MQGDWPLVCVPAAQRRPAHAFYVDPDTLAHAQRARDPLSVLIDGDVPIRRYGRLRPGADERLEHEDPFVLSGATNGFADLLYDEDALAALDPPEPHALLAVNWYDHSLWRPGQEAPVAHATRFDAITGASARYLDLERAQAALEGHPWVRDLEHDPGRPGSYDHVPAGIAATIRVPDDVHAALWRAWHARGRPHGAPGITAGALAEPLFLHLEQIRQQHGGPGARGPDWWDGIVDDPLGLRGALRTGEYREPDERDSWFGDDGY